MPVVNISPRRENAAVTPLPHECLRADEDAGYRHPYAGDDRPSLAS
jgi:hypothetical protein